MTAVEQGVVTPEDAEYPECEPFENTMASDRLDHVRRAGWVIDAGRRQVRTNEESVEMNRKKCCFLEPGMDAF